MRLRVLQSIILSVLIVTDAGYAQTSNQIMRKSPLRPDEEKRILEEKSKYWTAQDAENMQDSSPLKASFHIHTSFNCTDKVSGEEEIRRVDPFSLIASDDLLRATPASVIKDEVIADLIIEPVGKVGPNAVITPDAVRNDPLAFMLMVEVTKAHYVIAERLYKQGIDLRTIAPPPPRYHTTHERRSYPQGILKEIPEVVRSAAYVRYVMTPVLEKFMSEEERRDFKKINDILSLKDYFDSLKPREGRNRGRVGFPTFRRYAGNINKAEAILDKMVVRNLKRMRQSPDDPGLRGGLISALYENSWAAYKASRICPIYTRIPDPAFDPLYIKRPDGEDSLQLGYGLFARAKILTDRYFLSNKNIRPEDKQALKDHIQSFEEIYKDFSVQAGVRVHLSTILKGWKAAAEVFRRYGGQGRS